jgi:hypothetical protein
MGIGYIPDGFCPLGDNAALRLLKLPALFLLLGGRHLPELLHLALLLPLVLGQLLRVLLFLLQDELQDRLLYTMSHMR